MTKVKTGDKVVLSWIKGSGFEAGGAVYSWDGKKVNAGAVTTFQRHAAVSENRLTLVPVGMPMDLAVLLGCAAPTGMGAVFNVLKVQAGDSVAVFGSGGIGLNSIMAAAFAGAMPIIAIDPSPTRRAFAKMYGATHVIDPADGDVIAAVKAIVPQGVDVAVEASGLPEVMLQAAKCDPPARRGRAVIAGNAAVTKSLTFSPGLFNSGRSLLGTWGGDSQPDRDYGRFGRLLNSNRFPVRDLLSKPYALEQASAALGDLAAGRVGRPLIDMSIR